jgi:hypothetical protein
LVLGLLASLAQCKPEPKHYSLGVVGYNYTDLYISSFSVGATGGGNIDVSDMESGGGGTSCCLEWIEGTKLPVEFTIEWTRDREIWCYLDVSFNGPIPKHPSIFATHFYEDGHIEVEIAEDYPDVRVRKSRFDSNQRKEFGNSVWDDHFAKCMTGQAWLKGDPQ